LLNQGRVVDFLIVGTKTIHTGILNVADLLITTSVVMLCCTELFHRRGRSALK
jgi:lipoprotein signal peptidase